MPIASHILMIRPSAFTYNAQTAVNNAFQQQEVGDEVNRKAQQEFDNFVDILRAHKIEVTVIQDSPDPHTPDSIFPNNWFSLHTNTLVFYPMFAGNRRTEREKYAALVQQIATSKNIIDLSGSETADTFLEGTGSMVLDRDNHIAYACLSPRTDKELFETFCKQMGYEPVAFHAADESGQLIYHTNVMMCMADTYVVICLDSVQDLKERELLLEKFSATGKKVVTISMSQMNHFAGNMLQLQNKEGEKFLVMSAQAYQSLSPAQISILTSFNPIIHATLDTIERNGGGSARCMMAEMY